MIVCVAGGSRGIGRAVAERFAAAGAHVVVGYASDDDGARETVRRVERAGATATAVRADLADAGGARALIDGARAAGDRVDVLVHCAAMAAPGPLLALPSERLERSIAVAGTSLVHLVRECAPLLGPGSSVIYVTSRGGRGVVGDYGALGVAKALGDQAVRYLAAELAPRGVRVNAISPGALDTETFRAMFPGAWRERLAASRAATPAPDALTVDEVAAAVEALTGAAFAHLQGQTIVLDGGGSL